VGAPNRYTFLNIGIPGAGVRHSTASLYLLKQQQRRYIACGDERKRRKRCSSHLFREPAIRKLTWLFAKVICIPINHAYNVRPNAHRNSLKYSKQKKQVRATSGFAVSHQEHCLGYYPRKFRDATSTRSFSTIHIGLKKAKLNSRNLAQTI